MNHELSPDRGKLLRRSLAIPFILAASLPSVALAQPEVPAQEPVERTPTAPAALLASVTPVMMPFRPGFHRPFFPRPGFHHPFFPGPFFHHPFFPRPVPFFLPYVVPPPVPFYTPYFVPRPVPVFPFFPHRPVPFHPPFHHWGRI